MHFFRGMLEVERQGDRAVGSKDAVDEAAWRQSSWQSGIRTRPVSRSLKPRSRQKELQLPFLEASVKQERDEAQQIQMDCPLLPQRSTSLPVHWNGGAEGQPRQWKYQAPSGVQLTDKQRTQLSKAEKSVAEAIAASEATVIARTPFPPQAMEVDEEAEAAGRGHFEGL